MNSSAMLRSVAMYLLIMAVIALFAPMLTAEPMAWDDVATVRSISRIQSDGLSVLQDPLHRPLTFILFSAVDRFGPGSLFLFHLFPLLAHGVNILLFYRLLRNEHIRFSPSFFSVSLFALHPFIAPAVISISDFPVVLSSTFVLLFLTAVRSTHGHRFLRYAGGAICAILFHWTISGGVVLAAAWWMMDQLTGTRAEGHEKVFRRFILAIGFLSVAFAFMAWRPVMHDTIAFFRYGVISGGVHLLLPLPSSGIVPISALEEWFTVSGFSLLPLIVPFLLVGAVVLGERWRAVPSLVAAFILLSLPIVRWSAAGEMILNSASYYLSSMVVCFSAAMLIDRGRERFVPEKFKRGSAAAIAVLIVVVMGSMTYRSVSIRTTNERFWQWMSAEHQENEWVMLRYGSYRLSRYEVDDAVTVFSSVITRHPLSADAYDHRGVALMTKYDMTGAIADLRTAIRLDPGSAMAEYDLANAYSILEQWDSVIVHSTRAIDLRPDLKEAYNNRGNAFARQEKYVSAFADYASALRIDPRYADALGNRALIHLERGNAMAAYRDMAERAAIEKRQFTAQVQSSLTAFLTGDNEGVVRYWRSAMLLDSSNAKLYLESVLPTFIQRPENIDRFCEISGIRLGKSFQEKKTNSR